jgi:hypothetical protein
MLERCRPLLPRFLRRPTKPKIKTHHTLKIGWVNKFFYKPNFITTIPLLAEPDKQDLRQTILPCPIFRLTLVNDNSVNIRGLRGKQRRIDALRDNSVTKQRL